MILALVQYVDQGANAVSSATGSHVYQRTAENQLTTLSYSWEELKVGRRPVTGDRRPKRCSEKKSEDRCQKSEDPHYEYYPNAPTTFEPDE